MPNNDLISRAAAITQIKENYCDWCDHADLCQSCETRDCIATIEQQVPAVDAVPVRYGWWISHPTEPLWDVCSACGTECKRRENDDGAEIQHCYQYCPWCGARMMDGGDNDEAD